MARSDSTRAPKGATTHARKGEMPAFDLERDLIHPASEIVSNLRDALAAIGDRADTSAAAAEVDRLRDLFDDSDISATRALKGAAAAPLVLDDKRAKAALSASWEIEHLSVALRQSADIEGSLIVRGITTRIEELSHAIMSALDDVEMVTTEDIHFTVFRMEGGAA